MWDTATAAETRRIESPGRTPYVVLSPDGKTIAARYAGGRSVCLWEADSGNLLVGSDEDHGSWMSASQSADGNSIAVARSAGIQIWDIGSRRLTQTINADPGLREVILSSDGSSAVSRSARALNIREFETTIRRWDTKTGDDKLLFRGTYAGGLLSPGARSVTLWDHKTPVRPENPKSLRTRAFSQGPVGQS